MSHRILSVRLHKTYIQIVLPPTRYVMCCCYKWCWRRRNRKVRASSIPEHYYSKSLLEGSWVLHSSDNPYDRNEPLDDEETFRMLAVMAKSGRCFMTIKRFFTANGEEVWSSRVEAPATGVVETQYKQSEEVDELTCYRTRVTSFPTQPNLHKFVVRRITKDGIVTESTREVYPSDPNTLISTLTVLNTKAVGIFKRIFDDNDNKLSVKWKLNECNNILINELILIYKLALFY